MDFSDEQLRWLLIGLVMFGIMTWLVNFKLAFYIVIIIVVTVSLVTSGFDLSGTVADIIRMFN